MDQELVSRIAATAKSDLQLPDEQLPTIERYVKRAISRHPGILRTGGLSSPA